MLKKLPPEEKVYEAFSAIGDGRVEMHDGFAVVRSSDGSRQYTVEWDGNKYTSDDSATFWQGYPGYPVIAVLLLSIRYSHPDIRSEYSLQIRLNRQLMQVSSHNMPE